MRVRLGVPDVLLVVGLVGVVYGVALIYLPAAWIVGGLSCLLFSWYLARAEHPSEPEP